MDVATSTRVSYRSSMGQFIAACEAAETLTIKQAIEEGAARSRAIAPKGVKADPRTGTLKGSIHTRMTSSTSGEWYCDARHALPIEFGAAPHELPGNVGFFWENQGRDWYVYNSPEAWRNIGGPGAPVIQHPGNDAQPYLRPAYREILGKLMDIAKRNFPG